MSTNIHISPIQPAVILFDGVCNLCAGSVQMVLKNDPDGRFHFASLQSEIGQQLAQQHGYSEQGMNSFLLIEDGTLYTRSTAALRVARRLKGGWPLLYPLIILPRFLRDAVYEFIARNRYKWFGKKEACWLPRPEWRSRFLDQAG